MWHNNNRWRITNTLIFTSSEFSLLNLDTCQLLAESWKVLLAKGRNTLLGVLMRAWLWVMVSTTSTVLVRTAGTILVLPGPEEPWLLRSVVLDLEWDPWMIRTVHWDSVRSLAVESMRLVVEWCSLVRVEVAMLDYNWLMRVGWEPKWTVGSECRLASWLDRDDVYPVWCRLEIDKL